MFSERLLSALMLHIWLTLQLVNHGAVNEHNILIHPRNFQYSLCLGWLCVIVWAPGNICVIISSQCDIIRNVSLSSLRWKVIVTMLTVLVMTPWHQAGWPVPGYPLTLRRRITRDVRPNPSAGIMSRQQRQLKSVLVFTVYSSSVRVIGLCR